MEKLNELLNDIVENLLFINSDKLFFLFRHRLGRGRGFGLSGKELNQIKPKPLDFLANGNDFISRLFDLNKLRLGIPVKLTAFLNVFNESCGKQAKADRINFISPLRCAFPHVNHNVGLQVCVCCAYAG